MTVNAVAEPPAYNCQREGNLFTGYRKELAEMREGFRNSRSYVVLGGARCGKSSFLGALEREVAAKGVSSYGAFARRIDLDARLPHTVADFFRLVYEGVVSDCEGAPEWPAAVGQHGYDTFKAAMAAARGALERRYGANWLCVLLLDNLNQAAEVPEVFSNLRNLLQADGLRSRFRVVGTGLPDKITTEGSPLKNVTVPVFLRRLREEEARELLGAAETGLPAEKVLEWTGGHPFLMQALLERPGEGVVEFRKRQGWVFEKWVAVLGEAGVSAYRAMVAGSTTDLPDQAVLALSFHGLIDDQTEPERPRVVGTLFRDWLMMRG